MFLQSKKVFVVMWAMLLTGAVATIAAPEDDLEEGIHKFETGQFDDAGKLFKKAIKLNSADAEAHYYLGRVYFLKNDYNAAEKSIKRAIELQEDNSFYHLWLGNIYGNKVDEVSFFKKLGMAKKIKKHFSRAVELDEENYVAAMALFKYYLEAPGIAGGSKEKARQLAATLKEKDKDYGYRVYCDLYEKEKQYELAEKEHLAAIAEFPEKSHFRLKLGFFYQRRDEFGKAFELFEQMLADSSGNLNALYQVGRNGALSGQNLERAEEALKSYLQHEPNSNSPSLGAAHWRLGMVYEQMGKKEFAKKEYQQCLSLEPEFKQAKEALKKLK